MPGAGDIVWLTFDPQAGREQAGRRPALVLSPKRYAAASGLILACPITGRIKGYPFEVLLPASSPVAGAVLADHAKSLDWRARHASRAAAASPTVVSEVRTKLRSLIGL